MVVGGTEIVVSPSRAWRIADIEITEVVEVVRDVEGRRTVNWPDGVPDAIFLVAVRVKVEVIVVIVVQSGI